MSWKNCANSSIAETKAFEIFYSCAKLANEIMSKRFQRTMEDFVCANCGTQVKGNGYTNHCPNCLWSKHVDNNPGDRENSCQGMMEPITGFYRNSQWWVVQKCQKCGQKFTVKLRSQDNLAKLQEIVHNTLKR